MKEILTEIDISASASKTWEILTDFKNFPQWNPFIRQIEGTPIVGAKLKEVPGGSISLVTHQRQLGKGFRDF